MNPGGKSPRWNLNGVSIPGEKRGGKTDALKKGLKKNGGGKQGTSQGLQECPTIYKKRTNKKDQRRSRPTKKRKTEKKE